MVFGVSRSRSEEVPVEHRGSSVTPRPAVCYDCDTRRRPCDRDRPWADFPQKLVAPRSSLVAPPPELPVRLHRPFLPHLPRTDVPPVNLHTSEGRGAEGGTFRSGLVESLGQRRQRCWSSPVCDPLKRALLARPPLESDDHPGGGLGDCVSANTVPERGGQSAASRRPSQ